MQKVHACSHMLFFASYVDSVLEAKLKDRPHTSSDQLEASALGRGAHRGESGRWALGDAGTLGIGGWFDWVQ